MFNGRCVCVCRRFYFTRVECARVSYWVFCWRVARACACFFFYNILSHLLSRLFLSLPSRRCVCFFSTWDFVNMKKKQNYNNDDDEISGSCNLIFPYVGKCLKMAQNQWNERSREEKGTNNLSGNLLTLQCLPALSKWKRLRVRPVRMNDLLENFHVFWIDSQNQCFTMSCTN